MTVPLIKITPAGNTRGRSVEDMDDEAERRRVTALRAERRREGSDSCTCFISPPCSWCVDCGGSDFEEIEDED